jgi:hypothetical protein
MDASARPYKALVCFNMGLEIKIERVKCETCFANYYIYLKDGC